MVSQGLVVRLEAKRGKEAEVEAFLVSALPLAMQEPATIAWFAVKFGDSRYGIVDFFPDGAGRAAHLAGPIAKALMAKAGELLASPPVIENISVLADKLPG